MRKLVLILISLTLLFTFGCNLDNEPPGNEAAPPADKIKKTVRVPQTAPEPKRDDSPDAVAERLVHLAVRIPQVNDATAIVFGDYAIVGIDVNATLDRPKVGIIKYSVAEALKEDPLGANAIITSDPDILQRLRELNEDIKRGRPIKGLAEELSDIVGRIIPQVPKEVQKREQPPTKQKQEEINQTKDPKEQRKSLYRE